VFISALGMEGNYTDAISEVVKSEDKIMIVDLTSDKESGIDGLKAIKGITKDHPYVRVG